MARPRRPLLDRLLAKTERQPVQPGFAVGCLLWTGTPSQIYGLIRVGGADGGQVQVHRASYELFVGPIPEGMTIDHRCFNTLCIEPTHLEAVTQAENNRRTAALITHCPQGHEYTPENTYMYRDARTCRACRRERAYAKRHAVVASRRAA